MKAPRQRQPRYLVCRVDFACHRIYSRPRRSLEAARKVADRARREHPTHAVTIETVTT